MNELSTNTQSERVWTYEDMLRDAYLVIPPCYGKEFGECPTICPYLYECHPIEEEDYEQSEDYQP